MTRTWPGLVVVTVVLTGAPANAALLGSVVDAGGGLGWGLLLLSLAAVIYGLGRRPRGRWSRERTGALQARLARLKASHGRLLEAARRLDQDGRRGHVGLAASAAASPVFTDLARQTLEIVIEANAVGEELGLAEQALAESRAEEAEGIVADVDRRLSPLENELAAAVTTMAGIAGGQNEVRQASVTARARLEALRGRAVGENGLTLLASRLAEATRLADRDPTAALAGVRAVTRALDRLEGRSLSGRP